ncbi:hypothetical protein Q8F55_000277 [Vanrija albida]|uniref:Homeobox domain-containing protein n=1 Tax=Vanrija albida TaxID=181172 RepID=A0ABR3QDS7_9TREE
MVVTAAQLSQLVAAFAINEYPATHERDALAARLAMPSRKVQIWFQNRRRSLRVQERTARQLSQIDGVHGDDGDKGEDGAEDRNSEEGAAVPHKTSDVRNQ